MRPAGSSTPEVVYCNTATLGLPPRRTSAALESTLADWRSGRSDAVGFRRRPSSGRAPAFAGLVGVDTRIGGDRQRRQPVRRARGRGASGRAARSSSPRASSRPSRFPFLAQAGRGVRVREAPLARLADAVRAGTTLVAVSAVQSSDGTLADLERHPGREPTSTRRADARGRSPRPPAGCPWTPGRFDITVCGGYKWLLAPRGTSFMVGHARRRRRGWSRTAAGWYAGADRWDSIYGTPVAAGQRRPPVRHLAGVALVGRGRPSHSTCSASVDPDALQAHCVGPGEPVPAGVRPAPRATRRS